MNAFVLEEEYKKVTNEKTKVFLDEVISSYRNGNYRACVVTLYTAVIFDLTCKMILLYQTYNDENAKKILDDIPRFEDELQENPGDAQNKKNNKTYAEQDRKDRNTGWEEKLIKNIYELTEPKLYTREEREELLYLQKQRHFTAHPVLTLKSSNSQGEIFDVEMKTISKEAAMYLIRSAFEIVFLRDPLNGRTILNDMINDIEDHCQRGVTDKVSELVKIKYLSRINQNYKNDLFKTCWKHAFYESSPKTKYYRIAVESIWYSDIEEYSRLIKNNKDYFSENIVVENILNKDEIQNYKEIKELINNNKMFQLIDFIIHNPRVYDVLSEQAQLEIKNSVSKFFSDLSQMQKYSRDRNSCQIFLIAATAMITERNSECLNKVYHKFLSCIFVSGYRANNDNRIFYTSLPIELFEIMKEQAIEYSFLNSFKKFLIDYCGGARTFSNADYLFEIFIYFKEIYEAKDLLYMLHQLNTNDQYYRHENNQRYHYFSTIKTMIESVTIAETDVLGILFDRVYVEKNCAESSSVLNTLNLFAECLSSYDIEKYLDKILDIFIYNKDLKFTKHLSEYENIYKVLKHSNENVIERYEKYVEETL